LKLKTTVNAMEMEEALVLRRYWDNALTTLPALIRGERRVPLDKHSCSD
jgi:hypothetical protein